MNPPDTTPQVPKDTTRQEPDDTTRHVPDTAQRPIHTSQPGTDDTSQLGTDGTALREPDGAGRRVVIGVGNDYRRDDGFGPRVIAGLTDRRDTDRRLAEVDLRLSDGEPARLIDLWSGADLAVVVDAVRDEDHHAGQRHELTLDALDGLADGGSASSHGVSLGSTVALGRALGRLPRRLVVLAVSGTDFGFGEDLTAPVAAAVPLVVERACELVAHQRPQ